MSKFDEFDSKPTECAVFEAMCPEAVDGTLSAAEQAAFDKHVAGCVVCAQELADAQRGAAWMTMLKGYTPEPPAALLQRILAETTGAQAAVPVIAAEPEWQRTFVPVKPSLWASFTAKLSETFSLNGASMAFQPRLAMTAAMAFFSVALTLNMMGVRVRDLSADMLRPSSIQRTVADADASATRSFQNMRVVYEFESRVSDLRNNGDPEGKFGDNRHDPAGPFANGTANDNGSDAGSVPQSSPQGSKPKDSAPQDSTPHGKSDLELPLMTGAAARKGA